ncbi:hypothetical protein SLA2020_257900 [Shorea laevis]
MAGLPEDAKTFKELWDTWNIRGLTILSLLLQSFLILFAPLRRSKGDKWFFMIPLWIAYLLADWIAIFVIGLILRSERSHDILVFWAPFLLLHLGGPDTITSFSLEDNEFWIRHLLQLILQVGLTVYVIIQSLPHNKLLLPTLLVLAAGIIKYAERNRAFYLACFEHYGEAAPHFVKISSLKWGWNDSSLLLFILSPYGTIAGLLVGPLIPPFVREFCRTFFFTKTPKEVLRVIEFELSLLYEILHTKVSVINCKIGYISRIICMGFISGALLSFILITKAKQYHDELENSEVWVTYGLLIGAITLDFISIWLLISSDHFNTTNYSLEAIRNEAIMAWIQNRVINRHMWSKRIPQLNFITYCVKASPYWLVKLAEFFRISFILKFIQGFRSMSSQVFEEQVLWNFIFEQVKGKAEPAKTVEMGKEICLRRGDGILDSQSNENIIWSVKDLDYVESLLIWHIATELCFLQVEDLPSTSVFENPDSDYRKISKLLSDYMFYLLHKETVIRAETGLRVVFEHTYEHMQRFYLVQGKKDVSKRMISTSPRGEPAGVSTRSVLCKAYKVFNDLKGSDQGIPWKLMSKVWVELMCYAAINCRPNVHAQQPSMGGQLITIVWLLMNHFGLGTQFDAHKSTLYLAEETSV